MMSTGWEVLEQTAPPLAGSNDLVPTRMRLVREGSPLPLSNWLSGKWVWPQGS